MISVSLTPEELVHLTDALETYYIREAEYHGYDESEKDYHINNLKSIGTLLRRLENYYGET